MFKAGTSIEMTRCYNGTKGIVIDKTQSRFELYTLKLDNGVNLIAGPSAFITLEKERISNNSIKR